MRATVLEAGARLMEEGARAVMLARTDPGLAPDWQDSGNPAIDALEALVEGLLDLTSWAVGGFRPWPDAEARSAQLSVPAGAGARGLPIG
jgi:hypothetical protein